MLRTVMPHGLARYYDWKARFERLGAPGSHAWNEANRQALLKSRIELLPRSLGSTLNCVLDVGANLGDWTASMLEFCQIQHLHAFEPNPHLANNLKNRFEHHPRLKQFVLHQAAVGNTASQVTFNITAGSALSSVLVPNSTCQEMYAKEAAIVERVTVPLVRLDDVVPADQTIDVFKLDVQGYERTALEGSVETLKRTKAILLETHFISHYEQDDDIASLFHLMNHTYGFQFHDMSACERDIHGRATWADCCFINPKLVQLSR